MSTASITKENWWALVLGGVATLIFGLAVVFWPGLTVTTLLYLFSAYVLISGVVNVMGSINTVGVVDAWFLPTILGAFELGVGVYLLRHVAVKFTTFVLLIGLVLIVRGVVEAVGAYYVPARAVVARVQVMSYVSGLAAIVAGIVILFSKASAGVSFVWILGLYAIVVGILHVTQLSNGNR
ncbi:MAG TPA: DUF308 domain-containing protein [Verrucomicrobiae bacterium]|nr:DUF308 domain-containing protein [Verrucomicrobiae bacterium]